MKELSIQRSTSTISTGIANRGFRDKDAFLLQLPLDEISGTVTLS